MAEVFEGHNGQITLSDEALTISRKGFLGLMTQGLKGDKRIPYSSISAVQYRKAGPLVNGYIQFSILGGMESRGGVLSAGGDENTVMFRSAQNARFSWLRDEIERRASAAKAPKSPAAASSSTAEQLSKLADLLDRGLLSETEFLAEKAKILAS